MRSTSAAASVNVISMPFAYGENAAHRSATALFWDTPRDLVVGPPVSEATQPELAIGALPRARPVVKRDYVLAGPRAPRARARSSTSTSARSCFRPTLFLFVTRSSYEITRIGRPSQSPPTARS